LDLSATSFVATTQLRIEVVLTFRDLTTNQSLTIVDLRGQRRDVVFPGRKKCSSGEVILECWSVDWLPPSAQEASELAVSYKKAIAIIRSLYTMARLLPAWKLRKRLAKSKLSAAALKVSCRIATDPDSDQREDVLRLDQSALSGTNSEPLIYAFHGLETPAGKLRIGVEYRSDCDFYVDDSEALLSSQFATVDVQPSRVQSSLPFDAARRPSRLTSVNSVGSNSSLPYMAHTDFRAGSSSPVSRVERRPSFAIHPFKSPSLSASPANETSLSASARHLSRTQSLVSIERKSQRASSDQQAQRITLAGDMTVLSTSDSPRNQGSVIPPLKRYSSSFGQRTTSFSGRRRPSQASDSAVRSGSASEASSRSDSRRQATAQHDDDLDQFIKLLETPEVLKGSRFQTSEVRHGLIGKQSGGRIRAELDGYYKLRESHAALGDSLIQSTIMRPARSTVPSRRMSQNSPSLDSGGSSPGKAISPHTPSIPSRLSETSVMPRPSLQEQERERHTGTTDLAGFTEGDLSGSARIPIPSSPGTETRLRRSHEKRSISATSPLSTRHDGSYGPIVTDSSATRDQQASCNVNRDAAVYAAEQNAPKGRFSARNTITSSGWDNSAESPESAPHVRNVDSSAEGHDSTIPQEANQQRNNSRTGMQEDDDLFFAMSDIHLARV
jgi:autophagy-related protein 13